MRFNVLVARYRFVAAMLVLAAASAGPATPAAAQAVHGNTASTRLLDLMDSLGASRQQVESSIDGLQRARPQRRLPSGATAQLRQADVFFEGGHFEQTFYFSGQTLAQIDLVSLPGTAPGLFAALVAGFRTSLGAELDAGDSVSWVYGEADVMLYRYGDVSRPTVRLVVRQRRLVDAGEL